MGSSPARQARVAVIQSVLLQYREAFWNHLRELLDSEGVELALVHHTASLGVTSEVHPADLPWAIEMPARLVGVHGKGLVFESLPLQLRQADLLVVEQASRLASNYRMLWDRRRGGPAIAFWGHGQSRGDATASRLGEWIKRRMLLTPDWFFAYTDTVANYLVNEGFPADRITVVRNASDSRGLAQSVARVSPERAEAVKSQFGLQGKNLAMFLGALRPVRRFDLLLPALDLVRQEVPDFQFLFVGEGEERAAIEQWCASRPWAQHVGALFTDDLASVAASMRCIAAPGWAGLVVVDSFGLGVPLIVVEGDHPPERAYIQDGVNGVVVEDEDPAAYAQAIIEVLRDDALHGRLVEGCRDERDEYTIEDMARRFADGIHAALELRNQGRR